LFGQPSAALARSDAAQTQKKLKIGVVLSGGQAPGGHNVISGIFGNARFRIRLLFFLRLLLLLLLLRFNFFSSIVLDYLQERAPGSTLYGFKGGPAGIMKCKYVELTSEYIYPYRNQVCFLFSLLRVFGTLFC